MELLAPAGGFEQAIISIEAGCDALYGGLENWSARNRARNLSLNEYDKLMKICREKRIPFYLTINTLLLNSELTEIENLLSNKDFIKPDGILVADIGLYSLLSEKFPEIELHASTQLAAYSIDDVEFFQSLGFKRVVLARELTLEEIKSIRRKTDMELEVFVYGNQCVAFSGNCLWGGLLHTGSGHRGRCIGACCDIFEDKYGNVGHYFWSCNIGLFGMVKQLEEIGVDSIKIEGRVRPVSEIKVVVEKFRRALNGAEFDNDYGYQGYLGGVLPPIGAFNTFNPENTYKKVRDIPFSKYDYLVEQSGKDLRLVNRSGIREGNYAFTLFTKDHRANGLNIRIRFIIEHDKEKGYYLKTIDYVNSIGERTFYNCEETGMHLYKEISVQGIYEYLTNNIDVNIYECMSRLPANQTVSVDLIWLERTAKKIKIINKEYEKKNEIAQYAVMDAPSFLPYIFADSLDTVKKMHKRGFNRFLVFIRNEDELSDIENYEDDQGDFEIIYQLPYLDFSGNLASIYKKLEGKKIIITRLSQIRQVKKYAFSTVYGDYMLNIWNSRGAEFLKEHGLVCLIAHPELSIDAVKEIENESKMPMLIVKGGKIPLGYTRACFKNVGICNKDCTNSVTTLKNVMKGGKVQLVCNNTFDYRMIYSDTLFVSKNYLSPEKCVYFFLNTEEKEISCILHEEYPHDARIIYDSSV